MTTLIENKLIRRYFLSLLFALGVSACAGGGGCGGCSLEELPAGGVPSDQTLEGGAQLRISESGFETITEVFPAIIGDAFSNGTCVPSGGFGIPILADLDYCHQTDGSCSPGCEVGLNIDSIDLSVPQDDQLEMSVQFDINADVPVAIDFLFASVENCTILASANNIRFDVIVDFNIDAATGELELDLLDIPDVDLSINLNSNDCGGFTSVIVDLLDAIINGFAAILEVDFIRDLLTPLIEPIIQGLLPDPLGIEGVANVGGLIGDISPGTSATMEARIVPGGYVHLENGGLSLGIITGINADEDLDTRTPALDSEPALCVPPFAAPDFAAAPHSLSQNSRNNFKLDPANLFRGIPETTNDVVIGASETMLDQIGHHLISSGAFCLSLGTELVPQLNLAAIGILVPSLAELGTEEGNDPLKLVTRPAKAIDFTIGDGTEASPSLTMHLSQFSIDFYAFLFERYTRGFTVTLDMNIGVNLAFTTDADGNAAVMPMLVGLEAENIGVEVLNEEFLREDRATLEAVFPSLLDLILPLVTGALDSFPLPEIAGFRMDQLSVEKVTTSEDDFLAISADLASSTMMQVLGQHYPSVALLAEKNAPKPGTPTSASARLVEVVTPKPAALRAGIMGRAGGQLPSVVVELDSHDDMGRELEWTWNIEGGMWRPFIAGGQVALEDGAFNIQGKYQLQFRARPVDDYKSWDELVTPIEIVIDSVGPRILEGSIEKSETELLVPVFDNVYLDDVMVAFGTPGADAPTTEWVQESQARIQIEAAEELALEGELQVFARDPKGNESKKNIRISEALVASTGGCSTGGSTGLAGMFVVLFLLGAIRNRGGFMGLVLVAGLATATPACSCSGDPAGTTCELDEDCLGACEAGEVGQCFENLCRCLPDVEAGRIGQFSAMDMADDGTVWVSGYNSTHGDLMVATTRDMGRIPDEVWQYIDGVPEGPIVLPELANRGGIKAGGDDVGLYTDIAVVNNDLAMVSYFDATSGSLKFSANYGGTWTSHIIDAGDLSSDDATVTKLTGQYSSITLSEGNVPAIAYFAHIGVGTSEATTELRLARASNSEPRSGGDWTIDIIDSAVVPFEDAEGDVLKIPYGTGLFVDHIRDNADNPLIAYYDRINGDLKLSRFDSAENDYVSEILDGEGDVGWYPSLVIDSEGVVHVSYVDAVNQDLRYINDVDLESQLVDDGYRIVGTTDDGLPLPEFHFVGDDSGIVLTGDGIYIAYQDATTHELIVAYPNTSGEWGRTTIAGNEDPFVGAYGFFANAVYDGQDMTMSTWALDQANSDAWVELFRRNIVIE